MREPVDDRRPPIVDAAIALWAAALIGLIVTALLVLDAQAAVRTDLRRSLTAEHPDTKPADIGTAVDIAMVAAGVLAVVIVGSVIVGSVRVRGRARRGRNTLTTMGVATVVVAVAFWTVIAPARSQLPTAVSVMPFVVAGLAAAASAMLFVPVVTRWLKAAPLR